MASRFQYALGAGFGGKFAREWRATRRTNIRNGFRSLSANRKFSRKQDTTSVAKIFQRLARTCGAEPVKVNASMVDISNESPAQTEARLSRVMKSARLTVYAQPYAFLEFPLPDFPREARADAVALVRDDRVWSQLVPCDDDNESLFTLFRFHFPPNADNSGFVGWLATHLKQKFGTGVFVTCGQNRADGGIFDYWGVPIEIGANVISEVRRLVGQLPASGHGAPR